MSEIVFTDKSMQPDVSILRSTLGESYAYINKICEFVADSYKDLRTEWKFYGKSNGWLMKVFSGKRNLLFIIPSNGYFRVSFTFGQKAVQSILESDIQEQIKKDLKEARQYAEGKSVQVKVSSVEELELVLELIKYKHG